MKTTLKRVLAGVVTTAILGGIPLLGASPASAATLAGSASVKTANGAADLSSGDANDTFTLRLPAGASCAADGLNGGRWHTYMIPGSDDPTALAFSGTGAVVGQATGTGGTGTFRNNIYSTGGTPIRNQAPNSGDAAVINIPNMNYNVWTAGQVPSGVYNIGIACVDTDAPGNGAVDNLWNQQITVTYPGGDASGAQITWAVGAVPAAPAISGVTPGDASLTVAFTHAASSPATTGYTVTATPTGGGTAITATGAASPITVAGLTNGTEYSVTVRATNGVGDSPESAAQTATPNPGARPAVQNLAVTQGSPGSGEVTVSWDPPTGVAPTGYGVTISPAGGTITGTGTSRSITGLVENTEYQVTVTPLHPSPYVGTPDSVTFTVLPAAVVYQQLNVTVPEGVLTITQACGTGPSGCEVDFGTATLITTGTGAGQFYEAEAELLQLTVTDTRDEDPGWTATGTMGTFSAGPGVTFSGDQLGWTPEAVGTGGWTSPSGDYVQSVAPGDTVAPNTADGLGNGETLAEGATGAGLGIFTLDAHLELLIPIYAIDGDYSGVMTITAS